jgi:hypothetical protein
LVELCGTGLESSQHLAEEFSLLDGSGIPSGGPHPTRGSLSTSFARLLARQIGEPVFEAASPSDLGVQALRSQRPQLLASCRGDQGELLLGAQLARPVEIERHALMASRTRARAAPSTEGLLDETLVVEPTTGRIVYPVEVDGRRLAIP